MRLPILTKKHIIAIILVILIGVSFFVLYQQSRQHQNQNSQSRENGQNDETQQDYSNLSKISPPAIQKPYTDTIANIPIEIDIQTLDAPRTLPLYEIQNEPMTEQRITDLAKKLGFTDKASKSTDYTGDTIYSYYNYSSFGADKSLDVYAKQRTIQYQSGLAPDGTFTSNPSKEKLEGIVYEFLTKNGFIENKDGLSITNIALQTISPEGHTVRPYDPKNIAKVSLSQLLEGKPILGTGNEFGSIDVTLNAKFEVLSVTIESLPNLKKLDSYPLKGKDDINHSISEATIQDLGGGTLDVTDIGPQSVTRIYVTSATLAYLKESATNQKILQPIYVLRGYASYAKGAQTSATVYMPAIVSSVLGD